MKVGDLVKHFLTEQVGIVMKTVRSADSRATSINVMWTTQGHSLFGPGTTEWCNENSLDLLNGNR